MYIQEVKVTLLCEAPACNHMLELWPRIKNADTETFVGLHNQEILDAAKRKHWIVNAGLVFCSNLCELASRNVEVGL